MFILRRVRGVEVEHYMDVNRIDVDGRWENPLNCDPLHFPRTFDSEVMAAVMLKLEELKDPSWDYRIGTYYR